MSIFYLPQVLQKNMAVFSFLSQLAQEGRALLEFSTKNLEQQDSEVRRGGGGRGLG